MSRCFYGLARKLGLKLPVVLPVVLALVGLGVLVVPFAAVGQDWPQWQGPNRDGRWQTGPTLDRFPTDGPKIVWRREVAKGYSGPAVADGKVVLTDFVQTEGDATPNPGVKNPLKGSERIHCLNASDGSVLWTHEYPCDYLMSYPNGPRATPLIDGEKVYVLGAEGHLKCLQMADGDVVWEKDLKSEYHLESGPYWGFSAHPLIDGDTLYCVVGGQGSVAVAFDKRTGKEQWRALSAKAQGYCPPTMVEAHGHKTLLIWHSEAINGLDPTTGAVRWSQDLAPPYEMPIIAPIQTGNFVLATALQGASLLLELQPNPAEVREVWRGKGIHSDHNPPLIVGDHLYGVSGRGQLHGCDIQTGERLWESLITAPGGRPANSATGFMVKADDKYFIFIETGELVIAKLSPEGAEELSRGQVLEPTARTGNRRVVWSHPAFAGSRMYARNDKEIVCVELAKP